MLITHLHLVPRLKVTRVKWGDPKIPGIVKKIYLKYLYNFETLE